MSRLIIKQADVSTVETRMALHAALLEQTPWASVPLVDLPSREIDLKAGAMPLGSVEYVRHAMRVAGVAEPENMSYPACLMPLMGRRVELKTAGSLAGRQFIKPVTTKTFTGFVFDVCALLGPGAPGTPSDYTEHDWEQVEAFKSMDPDTLVWTSDPVAFVSEWRYYVIEGCVAGRARYDPDGSEHAAAPDPEVLTQAVDLLTAEYGPALCCGLDLGVLDDGRTVVIEVNDAWALGLYGHALQPREYLHMLRLRWQQIFDATRSHEPAQVQAQAHPGGDR